MERDETERRCQSDDPCQHQSTLEHEGVCLPPRSITTGMDLLGDCTTLNPIVAHPKRHPVHRPKRCRWREDKGPKAKHSGAATQRESMVKAMCHRAYDECHHIQRGCRLEACIWALQ
eukprot:gnl/TRDRNA2_/TRDRNA2_102931_c2_seq1.p1 gnl/TRDRNA2_/TRDRNA2_102931_c2~~gnl/TRDRNA2_/TRDRNA2_102931_c2_seq1.p1  ORF type:complete len:117 (-),score=4.85 gnl/TRDRNA2_/TRDRNA2_102931_c2_seq1:75-425(-)